MESVLESVERANDSQVLFGKVTNDGIVDLIMWCEIESVDV